MFALIFFELKVITHLSHSVIDSISSQDLGSSRKENPRNGADGMMSECGKVTRDYLVEEKQTQKVRPYSGPLSFFSLAGVSSLMS
jgi:hypothetical protein